MSLPTRGDTFTLLIEHLRLAQEDAAMLAHLHNANVGYLVGGAQDKEKAHVTAWLTVSEALKLMQKQVTRLA